MNGVIQTATGLLLRAGDGGFTAGPGETLRSDVPEPPFRLEDPRSAVVHRWNQTQWVKIPKPRVKPVFIDLDVAMVAGDVTPPPVGKVRLCALPGPGGAKRLMVVFPGGASIPIATGL